MLGIRRLIGNWFINHPRFWIDRLSVYNVYRALTGHFRVLPDFIILGGAKCGTTSMFEYLIEHPDIYSPSNKEINFFNRYFPRGINWYRGNFALSAYKFYIEKICRRSFLTGEATPNYLIHPLTAKRISEFIPNVKLIVLLRNPVERAYSHYIMEKQLGNEKLSFDEAIKCEENRLSGENEKMIENENYYSYKCQWYSYLASGRYVEQLKLLFKYFSKEQILILNTKELDENPSKIYQKTLKFFTLSPFELKFKKHNVGKYSEMPSIIRKNLVEYFHPHNEYLFQLLGSKFNWNIN